ncbi:MAG: 30S ribosomal protein S18 [Candidatus Nealsonbacteria bacterium RIFCSPHIGHO2_01_FULL_43_31]|uniref:30S ribosomal protein S18 n=2 Tax=Candidatus Nealsoniibacteriota TaxID=1817911 RepID=A0A1G2E676_9BACT|nr:MAG: 30S ribosomal protein S18 [Parcubacteria group bacterium GW2011_GWB1_43_6]OGZ20142.1 MAG: 30S ribosomal protein S18 [Candidatus Nealsonbacteria bacterium RIFCSPHIGHO2_01_FULL_43_31]OGZ21219.1 MAG: 30S ribosomal protein S18 [Candidatus Nealsonbacteria bacterium RIFCSPHIGHO2_02_FULL_43_13]
MECYFCKKNVEAIDFKDVKIIRHFVSGLGKIRSKKRTGVCSKHQRKLANAIKQARHLGLPLLTF